MSDDGELEAAFTTGSAASDSVGNPRDDPSGTKPDPFVVGAFTVSAGKEDEVAGDSCGAVAGTGGAGIGTNIGTGKNGERPASDATGRRFFSASFVLLGIPGVVLPAAVWEPLTSAVGPEGLGSVVAGVDSCEAHMAAKLPELRPAESARPKNPAGAAEAALLEIADSMAEVTVRVRADTKTRTA